MSEIKECPFCGGDGELKHRIDSSWWVECKSCTACGQDSFLESLALEYWNQRNSTPNAKIEYIIGFYDALDAGGWDADILRDELISDLKKLIGVSDE